MLGVSTTPSGFGRSRFSGLLQRRPLFPPRGSSLDRWSRFVLVLFVAFCAVSALETPASPSASIWMKSAHWPIFLIHSRNPAYDDAMEAACRKERDSVDVRWFPDTGIGKVYRDSNAFLLRVRYRGGVQGFPDLECGWLGRRDSFDACRVRATNVDLVLQSLHPFSGSLDGVLLSQPTNLPLAERGDAIALDAIADIPRFLRALRGGKLSMPDEMNGHPRWPAEALTWSARKRASSSPILFAPDSVARDSIPRDTVLGRGFGVVSQDSLEARMGRDTGLYLETSFGTRRTLRVRDLKTGDDLLDEVWEGSSSLPSRLTTQDLDRIRHRFLHQELRTVWTGELEYGLAAMRNGGLLMAGREVVRELHALAGVGRWTFGDGTTQMPADLTILVLGARFSPFLGWESLSRTGLDFGFRWWMPLGTSPWIDANGWSSSDGYKFRYGGKSWWTADVDLTWHWLVLGFSWSSVSEEDLEYSRAMQYEPKVPMDPKIFRLGIRVPIPSWRDAPAARPIDAKR